MEKDWFGEMKIFTYILLSIILLTMPASASNVLDIAVTESISLQDEFNGTLLPNGGLSGTTGQINITNALSSTDLYDITLNFSTGTTNSALWSTTAPGVNLTVSGNDIIVHINYLGADDSVFVNYSMVAASRPIEFSETYVSNKILINDSTNASLTLTHNTSAPITGITLIKTAADTNPNGVADFNFTNDVVTLGLSSIANNNIITWTIAELNATNPTATLNFTITEADSNAHNSSTPQSAIEFYVGNASLAFTISNGTISGSDVTLNEGPTATTLNFAINLQKNQLGTSEGGEGGDDWGFTPTIDNTDTEAINYTISAVTVYVTNSSNLNKNTAFATNTYMVRLITSFT